MNFNQKHQKNNLSKIFYEFKERMMRRIIDMKREFDDEETQIKWIRNCIQSQKL